MNLNERVSYESIGAASYLVLTLEPDEVVNYQQQMITSNEIQHLLPASRRQKNENVQLYYNITSRVSLSQILSRRKLTREEFLSLLGHMMTSYKEVREYQLLSCGICFDLDYIFVRSDNLDAAFIYLPVYKQEAGIEELKNLVQSMIMKGIVETTTDNFIQILLNTVCDSGFTAGKLEECVLNLSGKPKTPSSPTPMPVPTPVVPMPAPTPVVPVQSVQTPPVQQTPVLESSSFQAARPAVPTDEGMAIPGKTGKAAKPVKEKKEKKQKAEKAGASNTSGKQKFLLVQAVVLVLVAAGISFEVFSSQEMIMAAVILVAAAEFFAYRKTIGSENSGKEQGQEKPEKAKKEIVAKRRSNIVVPGKEQAATKEESSSPSSVPPVVPTPIPVPPVAPTPIPVPPVTPAPAPSVVPASMEDTVYMEEEAQDPYLEYYQNGVMTRVMLNKPSTILGRLSGQVDFVVNNQKVGKMHAEFINQNGLFYVKDLSSKNGTYINNSGDRITANVPYPLSNGDRITLADSAFVLRCQV